MRCRSSTSYHIFRTLESYCMQGMLEIDKLAQEVGISRRAILEHLAHLEYVGVLQRRRGYRCSRYWICYPNKVNPVSSDSAQIESDQMSEAAMSVTNAQQTTDHQPAAHSNNITRGVIRGVPVDNEPLRFNHPALRDILRDIECEFTDDFDNLVMRCFMDTTCFPHAKPTLYLRCNDGDHTQAGVWRCFRCGRRGFIDQLVRAWTGWGVFQTGLYLMQHQAYDDPNDEVQRMYKHTGPSDLRQYAYRHEYCHKERRLDEETCLRYELGFDQRDWMITIPVRSADGVLRAIKKRAVSTKVYQYLPTEKHMLTIFGINHIKPASIIWLCEGEFDAMFVDQALRRYGFGQHGALALGGKELSDRVLPQLQDLNPVYFVIALDNDKEGRQAALALQAKLSAIAPCMRMRYEDEQTKDPNASSEAHLATQARRVQSLASGKVEMNNA